MAAGQLGPPRAQFVGEALLHLAGLLAAAPALLGQRAAHAQQLLVGTAEQLAQLLRRGLQAQVLLAGKRFELLAQLGTALALLLAQRLLQRAVTATQQQGRQHQHAGGHQPEQGVQQGEQRGDIHAGQSIGARLAR